MKEKGIQVKGPRVQESEAVGRSGTKGKDNMGTTRHQTRTDSYLTLRASVLSPCTCSPAPSRLLTVLVGRPLPPEPSRSGIRTCASLQESRTSSSCTRHAQSSIMHPSYHPDCAPTGRVPRPEEACQGPALEPDRGRRAHCQPDTRAHT